MAFNYAFQQIVNLKSSQKTQAEWHLVDSIGRLRSEEHTLNDLYHLKIELSEMITNVVTETVSISHMVLLQEYSEHLDQQITNKRQDVQAAQQVVTEKQEILTERMVDEKVWSKAREKAFQNYTALLLHKEQNALDEMATNRFKRVQ
ncbi:flagellar export protein FliJ [Paenibacillus albiflavus]|uniref:Flagellar FliJ protein n=1 Tax=Paenibacillus albiflavus TaxID=2545760 RepID=A0A4R4ENV9_9BACL|nr:flagellar export protein FliJ [Paenibacillus albiflavus]TCZ80231.1 flagellar export protein FliJ [Paenibacillus albiflavus]